MKLFKYSIIMVILSLVMLGCKNEHDRTWDDKYAFVAFDDTDNIIQVDENAVEVTVPVHLSSVAGLEATINVKVVTEEKIDDETIVYTALLDRDFTLDQTSFSFDETNRVHNLHIGIIDNAIFDGNRTAKLIIEVVSGNVQTLEENYIEIRIVDNDEEVEP